MSIFTLIGKYLVVFGVVATIVGLSMLLVDKFLVHEKLWRLPGDIYIKKESIAFYFPIGTCITISFIISILLSIFFKK